MSVRKEEEAMQDALNLNECPHCGLLDCMILTGVYYTSTLSYSWKCGKCDGTGYIKYKTIKCISGGKEIPREIIIYIKHHI